MIIKICDTCRCIENEKDPATAMSRLGSIEGGYRDACNKCVTEEMDSLNDSSCCRTCVQLWYTKHPGFPHISRMIVCPTCGNKRCPKATDHMKACTGSNEPGQPGSVY